MMSRQLQPGVVQKRGNHRDELGGVKSHTLEVGGVMRRIKLFSLIPERVARFASGECPSRWSARRRASWSASGGSAAAESLEPRCLLAAGELDRSFGVAGAVLAQA